MLPSNPINSWVVLTHQTFLSMLFLSFEFWNDACHQCRLKKDTKHSHHPSIHPPIEDRRNKKKMNILGIFASILSPLKGNQAAVEDDSTSGSAAKEQRSNKPTTTTTTTSSSSSSSRKKTTAVKTKRSAGKQTTPSSIGRRKIAAKSKKDDVAVKKLTTRAVKVKKLAKVKKEPTWDRRSRRKTRGYKKGCLNESNLTKKAWMGKGTKNDPVVVHQ